ncbi:MAG TPA: PAS domain-containing protein, partial [Pirellulales bacterium]
ALGETEQRLHSILDNTPSIVYLKDAAGRYLLVNRAYETAFGISEEQVIGRPSEMFFPAQIAARFRENDGQVLESRVPFQFEEEVPVAGGIRTFLSVKFPVCNPQGEPFAVCGISTDITDRKEALERLRLEQEFLNQLIREHERDRQLMAYEIHDGLVQYMSGALLHLEGLAGDQSKLSSKGRNSLELAVHLIRRSIAEGRRVMSGLRPPILDEEGVVPAISYLVAEDASPGELVIQFSHRVTFDRLEPLLEGTIFRIVQEALTNVKRHSQAKQAEVKLIQSDGSLQIEVRDWGVGFNPADVSDEHFGLKGIRKRADLLGGQARIESTPGAGTHVMVDLPLPNGNRQNGERGNPA